MSKPIAKEFLEKIPSKILFRVRTQISDILESRKYKLRINKKYYGLQAQTNDFFKKYRSNCKNTCLLDLLDQPWGYWTNNKLDSEKKYYVYIHYDLKTTPVIYKEKVDNSRFISFPHKPFYVGKGTGLRMYNKNRSNIHKKLINENLKISTDDCWSQVFRGGLTEKEALILEAKLILFFGCKGMIKKSNHLTGETDGFLCNNEYPYVPDDFKEFVDKV